MPPPHTPPQVLRACLSQWQLTAEHTAMFLLNYVGTVWETWDFAAADAVGPRRRTPRIYPFWGVRWLAALVYMHTCHVYVC